MTLLRRIRAFRASICPEAQAHCDTADGPAVADGRRALRSGNVHLALKWVGAEAEAELTEVFDKAVAVRGLSPTAAEVADRLFLETLVRLHRMGEGIAFTGIRPSGTRVDPVVLEADRALEIGDDRALLELVPPDRREALDHRFREALGKKGFDVDDVPAGRDFIAAYVRYFKFAEGEDHEHGSRDHGTPIGAGEGRGHHAA
jgi:hypothetical protein